MKTMEFYTKVNKITQQDARYSSDAYEFINDAVIYTVKKREENKKENETSHISGAELLDGVGEYALKQFGPMAYDVFCEWGIINGTAVGNIVFNMIEYEILSRSENDSIKDFENAFDFRAALCSPFLPQNTRSVNFPVIA
jgi:uncharacterized repeat protein (TIGR04138 family)